MLQESEKKQAQKREYLNKQREKINQFRLQRAEANSISAERKKQAEIEKQKQWDLHQQLLREKLQLNPLKSPSPIRKAMAMTAIAFELGPIRIKKQIAERR